MSQSNNRPYHLLAFVNRSQDAPLQRNRYPGLEGEPIHPIFAKRNFRNINIKRISGSDFQPLDDRYNVRSTWYERLSPALRLVSALLVFTQPLLQKMMFADVKHGEYLDDDYRPTSADDQLYAHVLMNLSRRIRFMRFDRGNISLRGYREHDSSLGLTTSSIDQQDGSCYLLVSLCHDYWHAMDSGEWDRLSYDKHCTTWTAIAMTLYHELAHVIFQFRQRTEVRAALIRTGRDHYVIPEPRLMRSHTFKELGRAITKEVFGGDFVLPKEPGPARQRMLQVDGTQGIFYMSCDDQGVTRDHYLIAPNTVIAFFDPRTWREPHRPVNIFLLRPLN